MSQTDIRQQIAQRRIKEFERKFGRNTLDLAYHAALPVALNSELLHLLRINFFLDSPQLLPYMAEIDLLLSPLCQEIGEDLYEIDSTVRDELLIGLVIEYGHKRLREVAVLLWEYIERRASWADDIRLERAQQLTALNFLEPETAEQWLEQAEKSVTNSQSGQREWFVAMRKQIEQSRNAIQLEPSDPFSYRNPYNYNLPVDPEMFFGRQKDIDTLIHDLTTMPGDSIALIGGPRMGKTSLLKMIWRTLKSLSEESTTGLLPLPIFLDLTGWEVDSPVSFFRLVSEETYAVLANLLDTPPHAPPTLLKPPAPALRRVLKQWNHTTMMQRGCRLRLILLLDECEEIVTQPWVPELYNALRFLLIDRSTRSLLKVVMAGSHRFLTEVPQRGSPLRNVLTYHTLRVLSPHATSQLITQSTGGILTDETAQAVARQSGGHPFLTQYLMHHLWGAELESATPETVQQVAAAFPRKRTDFWDWINDLGESRLRVYRYLAENQAPITEDDIRAALTPPLSDLPQALEALCYHGVVVHEGESYRIAGQMFHDWFMANMASEKISVPEITSKILLNRE